MVVIMPGIEIAGQVLIMMGIMLIVVISLVTIIKIDKQNKAREDRLRDEIIGLKRYINWKFSNDDGQKETNRKNN